MVTFGQSSGPIEPFSPILLSQKGSLVLTRPFLFHFIDDRHALEEVATELFDNVIAGKIRINVNQRYKLADAADGHRALQSRETTGSTIFTVDSRSEVS